jgi:DNA-binding transcriptional ArsR family regulator
MAMVMPEARATMDAWNDMQVQIAVLKQVGDSLRSGMRLGPLAPELEPFFEMTGGLMILLQLLVTSRAGDTPMPCISELASRFGLSRAQVRNILKRARMDGFVAAEKSSRDPIDILPRLADSVDHFMAGSFAYFGRCMRLALAQE